MMSYVRLLYSKSRVDACYVGRNTSATSGWILQQDIDSNNYCLVERSLIYINYIIEHAIHALFIVNHAFLPYGSCLNLGKK